MKATTSFAIALMLAAALCAQEAPSQAHPPQSAEGLAAQVDSLEAAGRWQSAIPYLQRLLELEPQSARRLFQLGQWTSWSSGRAQALPLLKRATELEPSNSTWLAGYAEVLAWDARERPTAIALLRKSLTLDARQANARRLLATLLAAGGKRDEALKTLDPAVRSKEAKPEDLLALAEVERTTSNFDSAVAAYRRVLEVAPDNLDAMARLGEILSWRPATRPEAARLFERGLRIDAARLDLLVLYANMLSWSRSTRTPGLALYDRALALDASNASALAGKANLLAWSGQIAQAVALYDRSLAVDPGNTAALRGKGDVLTWRQRFAEAHQLLTRANEAQPGDPFTLARLARADLGLHHYADARTEMAGVDLADPDADDVRFGLRRVFGAWIETGFTTRRNRNQLNFYRPEVAVSAAPWVAQRLTFRYRPTWFVSPGADFQSNYYQAAFDSEPAESAALHLEAGAETMAGRPTQADGALAVKVRLRPAFGFNLGARREAVDESTVSTRGVIDSTGVLGGQVRSNLGNAVLWYANSRHAFDISMGYSDGLYTGRNLDSNRRWGLDLNIGKAVHRDRPYIRLAYGASWLGFDHSADFQPGQAPPRIAGGYWSPWRYLLNYGAFSISHRFSSRLEWDAGGNLGAQQVRDFSGYTVTQFASSFSGHLVWRMDGSDELRLGYEYQNVYNAYRRSAPAISWRHYF